MSDQPQKKVVWIKCRARHGDSGQECEGNQCEVVFERNANASSSDGSFIPTGGGKAVRYRCLTCKGTFHINT